MFSTVVADYCVLVVALLQDGEEAVREEMAGSVGILLAHISPLVGESWSHGGCVVCHLEFTGLSCMNLELYIL